MEADEIVISIDFSTLVNVLAAAADRAVVDGSESTDKFDISDISISAYNEDGVPVTAPALNEAASTSTLARGNPNTGKNAVLTIPFDDGDLLLLLLTMLMLILVWAAIDTLYVSVPESKFINADLTLGPEASAHAVSVRSDVLKIELVGADVGDAKYSAYGDTEGIR